MILRTYQEQAIEAIKKDLPIAGNSVVVMPTASGKSWVIAHTATFSKNVLILQPSQELLQQNMDKLLHLLPEDDIGVYSSSFGRKEIKKFTFATIQSVYKVPELFKNTDLVIIDECHGLAPRTVSTMYKKFLTDIGNPKTIGFTATPYRLEVGYSYQGVDLVQTTMLKLINRMRNKNEKEMFWKRIIFNIHHQDLLSQGYLSPIEYLDQPLLPYHEIPINKSRSDYNLEAYTRAIVGREAQIISTIAEAQKWYKSVLVFCSTTEQACQLSEIIVGSKVVLGETPTKERKQIIAGFKNGTIKTVFNVGTLTTGFDHPALDCVVLLRPTRSIVLYNQMIGRLTRIAPGKQKGTVIDFTSTCKAIGRVETFKLYRNERGLWDLCTEKHATWHDRVLFSMVIQK